MVTQQPWGRPSSGCPEDSLSEQSTQSQTPNFNSSAHFPTSGQWETPQRPNICTQESKLCQAAGLSDSIYWLTACGLIQGLRGHVLQHTDTERTPRRGAEHSVRKPGQQEEDEDKRTAISDLTEWPRQIRKGKVQATHAPSV